MDLYEYQARDLFEAHGVPVLAGIVAQTPDEAKAAAEKIGGVTVVKAQVKVGGRGKAGGVKVAKTADEAYEHAKAILGMDIKGHTVHQVMIAQGADIAEEYYFSVLLDRANRTYLAMCSVEGGMEIEQLAEERPEALARIAIDASKRSPLFPDIPTLKEVGATEDVTQADFAIWAPKGTSKALAHKIRDDIAAIGNEPSFRDKVLVQRGLDPQFSTPEQFADYLQKSRVIAEATAKKGNLQPQ